MFNRKTFWFLYHFISWSDLGITTNGKDGGDDGEGHGNDNDDTDDDYDEFVGLKEAINDYELVKNFMLQTVTD